MSPRLLLLGGNGQLGYELGQALQPLGTVEGLDRRALDLGDPDAVRRVIRTWQPDVIVNAAAWTAVDAAEAEPVAADLVNHLAPRVMAEEAATMGALLVHYSTDYVYDGARDATVGRGYVEADLAAPLNVYGRTKLAGDLAIAASGARHLIFRTSWLYGRHGGNFVATMRALMLRQQAVSVVADQWGGPTPACQVALVTALALQQALRAPAGQVPWGVYHVQAAGATTWHGWATALHAAWLARGLPLVCTRIDPVTSSDWPTAARRPLQARLDCGKLRAVFGLTLPHWQALLAWHLDD